MGLLNRSLAQIEQRAWKKGSIPDYWDGKAGERIVERLVQLNIAE
jgi:hypothetical protein